MQITNKELLEEIKKRRNEISREEVLSALKEEKKSKINIPKQKIVSIFTYIVGVLIILIGVFLLIEEFWDDMGSLFRVGITYGLGIIVFTTVLFFEATSRGSRIFKEPLSILSAILIFIGAFIAAKEFSSLDLSPGLFLVVSLMLTAMFSGLYILRHSSVYLFFIVIFATTALYSILSLEYVQKPIHQSMQEPGAIFAYLTSLLGLAYLYLAYLVAEKKLSSYFYFIGGIATASPLFFLAEIYSAPAWNIIALLLIATLGALGLYLQRNSLALAGGVLIIYSLFGMLFYDNFFSTTISTIFFSVIILFIAKFLFKNKRITPCASVIIVSFTMIPYAVLSLNFMQKGFLDIGNTESVYLITTSLIGLSYILLGYFFHEKMQLQGKFAGVLYFLGSLGLILPLFTLGGIQGGGWDVVAIFTIIGLILTGIHLQEKILIITAGILLAMHVILISYRYFAESIGWPITLIIAGIFLIAIGYFSYTLTQKIKQQN